MLKKLRSLLRGDGVKARTIRSSMLSISGTISGQLLRLASNLILTRLLFPEAFGIVAIVQVFLSGLQMFSDTGIRTSIMQNKRGDETDFLNTAWTIQVGRGILLWLAMCALALPVATLYDEPILAQLLPVSGLNAIVAGLQPTAVHTANRHLRIGRLSLVNTVTQILSIAIIAGLAWALYSVWALVIGGILTGLVRQSLLRIYLPDSLNRLRWDPEIGRELFHFGKYIFFSTAFGFLITHADRAILGAYIPLAQLGVYTIAVLLASVPMTAAQALTSRVVMPLYRIKPMQQSAANRKNVFRVRRTVIATGLAANAVLGFSAIWLVDLLYDARYAGAGPILVLLCAVMVPRIVFVGSGAVLLSNGDSRRFMILLGAVAIAQTAFIFLGITLLGIFGAILAPGLAILVTSPLRMSYSRRFEAWDARGEAAFLFVGLLSASLSCWLHWDEILALFP